MGIKTGPFGNMPIRGRQFRDFSETVAPYTISV